MKNDEMCFTIRSQVPKLTLSPETLLFRAFCNMAESDSLDFLVTTITLIPLLSQIEDRANSNVETLAKRS